MNDKQINPMQKALALAAQAAEADEVPVGAVVLRHGEVIAAERNRMRELGDPTGHAEMLAIRTALARLGTGRLGDCDLYVTLEPCTMCAGAIAHARLRRVYYAAADPKAGAIDHGVRFFDQPSCHHKPEVIAGLNAQAAERQLKQFFSAKR